MSRNVHFFSDIKENVYNDLIKAVLFSNVFKFGSLENLHKVGQVMSSLVYVITEEICWH